MEPKHLRTRAGTANLALLCLLGLAIGPAISRAEPEMGTGLRAATPEEVAALGPYQRWITGIRLTPLGQQRIVEALDGRGRTKDAAQLATLDVSAFGEDLELAQAAPKSAGGAIDVKGLSDAGLNVEMLSLPAFVDNSTLAAFPPIGSQGPAGSCAAFSTTYYQLTYTLALQRGWNAKSGGTSYHMSPKWTFNMLNGGGDSASRDACLIMGIQNGCATWAEFPYDSDYKAWVYNDVSIWRAALNRRLSVWGTVTGLDTDEGLYRLKQLLNNGHILTFGTYVTSWSQVTVGNDPATTNDTPFVGQKICRYVDGSAGPHAMTIVGYNDALWCDINGNGTVDTGEKGALKIANQYGTGDWNSGFRWLAYDALRQASRVPGVSGPAGRNPAITLGAPTWVAAQPQAPNPLVGVYRVKHSKRSQMTLFIGIGTTNDTAPATTWSFLPSGAGGAYGFDGVARTHASSPEGTFAVSMDAIAPVSGSTRRYFLGMRDAGNNTDIGQVFEFRLENQAGTVLAATNTAITVDGGSTYVYPYPTSWVWVDYLLPAATPPVVNITAPGSLAYESGSVAGMFRISRTGDTAQPCSVAVTVSGRATEARDYQPLPRLVEIPAGSATVDLAVAAIDDWSVEETESVTLSLLPDPGYTCGPFSNATVDILSDDTLALVVPYSMRVAEGTTKPLIGVLTAAPAAPLTITFSMMPRSYTTFTLPATPTTVTRDATNWDQPFSVSITVPENAKTNEFNMGSVYIDAPGIPGTSVTIWEIDNEAPNLIIDPDMLFVPEGGNAELRVKYTYPPTQPTNVLVKVAAGSTPDPDLQVVSGTNMVFDATNWNVWQTAVFAAGQDADCLNGVGSFALRLQGGMTDQFSFPVYEIDNDTTLTITAGPGGTASPSGAMVVTMGAATAIAATTNAEYAFTSWSVVIGTATFADSNAANTTVTIGAPATIQANFVSTRVALVTSASSLSVPEGGASTFQLRLSYPPEGTLTVHVTRTDGDSDVGVSGGASLTFNSGNWNTFQTVTLTAVEDDDRVNGAATITCSASGADDVTVTATEMDNDYFATGGTVTNYTDAGGTNWTAHIFTSSGTFTNLSLTNVEVLVVAGGGGGGQNGGGGGGAGGVIYSNGFSVAAGSNYTVSVGGGGPTHPNDASNPKTGTNSVFGSLTALGGGGGASRDSGGQGAAGGSGGGGGGQSAGSKYLAGSGTTGQGNSGGNGTGPSDLSVNATGGGGGGAGTPGTAGVSIQAGHGGTGVFYAAFANLGGSPAGWFAGGGAGGRVVNGSNGTGGKGGGGDSSASPAANTGGGGCGAGSGGPAAQVGGSGIVIVRYVIAAAPSTPTTPTGFVATAVATNRIELAWSDNASNETGYLVEHSLDSNAWVLVTVTGANATNYSDSGLTTNTLYYYRVAASNAGGVSAYCYASARTWTVYEQWQRLYFDLAGLNNLSISGATADPDHDGLNNEQEYWAGTIPTNAASCLVLYALTINPAWPGEYVVRWQSATGRLYTVQAATNLAAGFTVNLRTNIFATPPVNVHTDAVGSAGQKFYRVKVE